MSEFFDGLIGLLVWILIGYLTLVLFFGALSLVMHVLGTCMLGVCP